MAPSRPTRTDRTMVMRARPTPGAKPPGEIGPGRRLAGCAGSDCRFGLNRHEQAGRPWGPSLGKRELSSLRK